MGSNVLHEAFSIRRPYCKLREEERRGIPKRYGRGLHSTRRTNTRQVPGFEFDEFVYREWAWSLSTFSPIVSRMPSHAIGVG
jgi:hypothetical protein